MDSLKDCCLFSVILIIIEFINYIPPKPNPGWSAWQEKFIIINKNTLVKINVKPINNSKKVNFFYTNYYDRNKIKSDTAIFVPVKNIPNLNNWLKKEKWFWCNEKDWQQYMDSIKQK